MPDFTYTYDLNEVDRLARDDATPPHALLSGFTHIQELTKSIKKAREPATGFVEPQVEKLADKKALTEEEVQEAQNRESEVRAYIEGTKILGHQLARDLNRVDYSLKGQANTTGNEAASEALAQEFMKDLTEPQQLLLDQSQGLANPMTRFLMKDLKLPNQTGEIRPKFGMVPSATISKEGDVLQIDRVDNFYTFAATDINDSTSAGTFFYKESGKAITSVSIDENDELYKAIDDAIKVFAKKPFDPNNPQIKIEHPPGTFMNIEPIITVNNEIQMGKTVESLSWKTKVTTHSSQVKITDGIFDKNKKKLVSPGGITPLQVVASILVVLAFGALAAVGGLLAGTVIGMALGGPAGAALGGVWGAIIAGVVVGAWITGELVRGMSEAKAAASLAEVDQNAEKTTNVDTSLDVSPEKTVENTAELSHSEKWREITTQFKESTHYKQKEKPIVTNDGEKPSAPKPGGKHSKDE